MADSDVIGGIENLTDAVSGETPSYEYKNPNTDMMKAINKCIDAATGETGTEYEYDNPNTDVIQKMEELATAIASSGGGGVKSYTIFENGKWYNDDIFAVTISPTGSQYITISNGNLVYFETMVQNEATGISIAPVDTTKGINITIEFEAPNEGSTTYYLQCGRCAIGADARLCQQSGTGRYSYHDTSGGKTTGVITEASSYVNQGIFFSGAGTIIIKSIIGFVTDTPRAFLN